MEEDKKANHVRFQKYSDTYGGPNNGLGIYELLKAFIGKPQFSGGYDQDVDNCFQVFETLASMCQVRDEEKRRTLRIMLTGDALSLSQGNPTNVSHTTMPEYF